jgi:hypothetical protein
MIGFSLYLFFANWGDLDPGFFIGSGLIVLLFGLLVAFVSCFGCQGVNNQNEKIGKS